MRSLIWFLTAIKWHLFQFPVLCGSLLDDKAPWLIAGFPPPLIFPLHTWNGDFQKHVDVNKFTCLFITITNTAFLCNNLMINPSSKEIPSEQVQGMTHVWSCVLVCGGFLFVCFLNLLNMPVNSGRYTGYCSGQDLFFLGHCLRRRLKPKS